VLPFARLIQVELKISPPSTPEYDECAESRAATPRLVARRGRPAGVRSKIDALYTGLRFQSSVKHSSSEDTRKAMSHTSHYKPQIVCGTRSGKAKQAGESSMLTSIPIPIRSPDALESADRPRRDVVKRKRLVEDNAINEISQSALSQALCRLKAVANSLALTFGHLFQVREISVSHTQGSGEGLSLFAPPLSAPSGLHKFLNSPSERTVGVGGLKKRIRSRRHRDGSLLRWPVVCRCVQSGLVSVKEHDICAKELDISAEKPLSVSVWVLHQSLSRFLSPCQSQRQK